MTRYSATIKAVKKSGGTATFQVEFIGDDGLNQGSMKENGQVALYLSLQQHPEKFKNYASYQCSGISILGKIKEPTEGKTISVKPKKATTSRSVFRKPYLFIPFRIIFRLFTLPFRILWWIIRPNKTNNYLNKLINK